MVRPCPCCGYLTIDNDSDAIFDICEVCHWQYDEFFHSHPDLKSGANRISLSQAKKNFEEFGACDARFIGKTRPPYEEEISR